MTKHLKNFCQSNWKGNYHFVTTFLLFLLVSCTSPPTAELVETAVPETTVFLGAETEPTINLTKDPPQENREETPDIQPVTIQNFGFAQVGNQIGYGGIFFNPNRDYFVHGVLFNVKVFDANGNQLTMHVEELDFIAPEESTGVGGTFELDDNQTAHHIEVKIDGQLDASLTAPPVLGFYTLPQNIVFIEETQLVRADGLVVNAIPDNSDETVIRGRNNFGVTAIVFDAAGRIIGGGYETIGQTVRNGTVLPASVSIPVIISGLPETVEIYANLGHKGGLCLVTLDRNGGFARSECPLTTHTGG